MPSAFYGLQISKTGLFASQKGLELVSNNVANSSTVGYTRQRLNLSSIPAPYGSGMLLNVERGMVGSGVSIDKIEQCRDYYLDIQFRSENCLLGEWAVKSEALYYIEDLFNITNEAGIDDALRKLFDSFEELSKAPESKEIRTLVQQNAIVFTDTMNYYSSQLEKLQNQQNDEIAVVVNQINSLISLIDDYNTQIVKYERSGDNANELRDKRNTALDTLSGLIDITYSENERGIISVNFGKNNECLIDANGKYLLALSKDLPDYYGNADKFYSITTSSGNIVDSAALNSGELKGYFDMRDGSGDTGIPFYMEQLDKLARGIVETFNLVHQNGFSYPDDSNGNVSVSGINFFDPAKITAKTISLDDAILSSVYNIAASSVEIVGDNNKGNSGNILEILTIAEKTDIDEIANIEQFLKSIVSNVAVQTSFVNGKLESQNVLINNILYKRESVSGVSLDEEMTNMIVFQKSYSAAARLITAFDEQLDTLINRTGLVGR